MGALTSNDFRFQMRVWFLKETKSIDVNCGTGSNITVWTRGREVFRITPRENNAVNSCWMPDSHRLNFHYLNSEARLTRPLAKVEECPHAETDWPSAVQKAAQGLLGHQPGEVAIVASGWQTNEELFLLKKLADYLGTDQLTLVPRTGESDGKLIAADRNANTTGAKLIWGVEDPGYMLESIREGVSSGRIRALLVFYEDLVGDAGFKAEDLTKLEHLVSNHILPNKTAAVSGVVLPGAGFTEKRGSMVNITGRLQRLNKAVEPPEGAMDDWEIIRDLLKAVTRQDQPMLIEDVFKEMAGSIAPFDGLTLSKIGDLGLQVTETGETIPLLEKERGRIERQEIVG